MNSFSEIQSAPRLKVLLHIPLVYVGSLCVAAGSGPILAFWGALLGAFAGYFFFKKIPTRFAFWVWLVPGSLLAWNAWYWQHTGMVKYASIWDTYFGTNCGGSECLYQILFTAPFYTAVFYSLGAFLSHKRSVASVRSDF
jgi:hypothetical protein